MESKLYKPICKFYEITTGKWLDFKTLILVLPDEQEIFHYENKDTESSEIIRKVVTYNYVAYYSRYVPSRLTYDLPVENQNKTII